MRKLLWLAAVLAVSLVMPVRGAWADPPSVEPRLKLPGCDAINFWADQVNATTVFNVAPRLTLPKAFQDIYIVPMFGFPALEWSPYDVQAASQALMACYQEAIKRHDQFSATVITNANRVLVGTVPRTAEALRKAKADADVIRKELDALPPSADLARGIDGLLKGNPAAPDMNIIRGLPRQVSEPIWRLTQVQLTLAGAERETLWKALGERRRAMEATLVEEAAKQIADAPNDANGVIALMEIRQRATELSDPEATLKLTRDTDDKAGKIRQTLRQAKPPAWTPPSCLDLYRWSSTPNAGGVVTLGRRGVPVALIDERAIPVFGTSIGDWSDEDLARFKTLRAFCKVASLPRKGVVAAPDSEAAELLRVANRGRWIEGADQQIADARVGMADYHKARQELAALRVKMQALPNTAASIAALAVLLNDPVMASVGQDDRTAFAAAVAEKRAVVGTRLAEAAVKGLDGVKAGSMADLGKLFQYATQTYASLPDQQGLRLFSDAFNRDLDETVKRLLPEFNTKLDAVPATIGGLGQVKGEEAALGDGGRMAAMKPFHDAARARYEAITNAVHDRACGDLLSNLGVGRDASQDVWDGDKGMKLGDFICGLSGHGVTVSGYSGAGMFSSTSTLKLTPLLESIETVSLRKSEVKAGVSMLAGYKVVDANGHQVSISGATGDAKGEAAVSISGWETFARQAKGDGPPVLEACKTALTTPPAKLGPGETLFWLHCRTLPEVLKAVEAGAK